MEELIIKYLNRTYRMNIDDFHDSCVTDMYNHKSIDKHDVYKTIMTIFDIESKECDKIVHKWWVGKQGPFIEGLMLLSKKYERDNN
jgi:hypothetical protein